MNFNKVILAGNMTRDPVQKQIPGGSTVCEFGLAINRHWKDKDGNKKEEVCFVDCAAFGKTGDIIQKYFLKGKAILIDGRLKWDQWDDKNGGGKRSRLSVVVEEFAFAGGKIDGEGQGGAQAVPAAQPRDTNALYEQAEAQGNNDIPF